MKVSDGERTSFLRRLRGQVTLPGEARYDELREPWLQIVDQRPAFIVEAACVDDVIAAVKFAGTHELQLAVMATGHGIALPCDGGLLLRLTRMKGIDIDAARASVRLDAGVISGELTDAAHARGFVYPTGQVSNVGVVGFALGGGIGWLVRKFGVCADSILAADVVLADGSLVRATADENADLFWALRGGGGNFGVVVSLEMTLYPVRELVGGQIFFPLERAGEIMRFYREWSTKLGNDTSTILRLVGVPPDPAAPPEIRGKRCCMVGACQVDPNSADAVVAPLRALGGSLLDNVKRCTLADLTALDPASHRLAAASYGRAEYLNEFSDEVIDGLVGIADAMIPPLMQLEVQQLGGAFRKRPGGSGAFAGSASPYLLHLETVIKGTPVAEIATATNETFAALGDAYTGEKYYNFMRSDEQPSLERAFGVERFKRLRAIKRRYDPSNVFRTNLNIEPE